MNACRGRHSSQADEMFTLGCEVALLKSSWRNARGLLSTAIDPL
jgi:hypothetical protein